MELDISDSLLMTNRVWDLAYLQEVCRQDFYEFDDLWSSNINDMELVKEAEILEKYCPITDDISLDDQVLCSAVEKIRMSEYYLVILL